MRDADHTPPSSAEVKKELSYTSTHPMGAPGPVTGFPPPFCLSSLYMRQIYQRLQGTIKFKPSMYIQQKCSQFTSLQFQNSAFSYCIYMWSTWLSEASWVLKETFPLEAVRHVHDYFTTFVKHVADCSIMTVHTLCKHKNGICMSFSSNGHDKENTIFWSLHLTQHLGRNM